MHAVEVSHVAKSFGSTKAVVDTSFTLEFGEILGLLGPNGAGKTTTIRLILDIFKPDHGSVSVLGGPISEEKKDRVGYMPEERGLYQDAPLERCLLYLASLKRLPARTARERLAGYLERFDLAAHKDKKVKELSKGMQQKAQVINTILHEPDLVIIDEPFAALDPINAQLVKDVMRELRGRGAAILMSTHQMHQVEELCDRIVLIDSGCDVLYGNLTEIRRRHSGHAVLVRADGKLPDIPGTQQVQWRNGSTRLALDEQVSPQEVLETLVAQGVILERFEIAVPTLDEIFIRVVEGGQA